MNRPTRVMPIFGLLLVGFLAGLAASWIYANRWERQPELAGCWTSKKTLLCFGPDGRGTVSLFPEGRTEVTDLKGALFLWHTEKGLLVCRFLTIDSGYGDPRRWRCGFTGGLSKRLELVEIEPGNSGKFFGERSFVLHTGFKGGR